MHRIHRKRIRRSHNSTNIGIVFEILNRNMQRMPPRINIRNNRLPPQIAIRIHHITTIPHSQQLRVITRIINWGRLARMFDLPRTHTVLAVTPLRRTRRRRQLRLTHIRTHAQNPNRLQSQIRQPQHIPVLQPSSSNRILSASIPIHHGGHPHHLGAGLPQRRNRGQR